jgi:hypothetical protein
MMVLAATAGNNNAKQNVWTDCMRAKGYASHVEQRPF